MVSKVKQTISDVKQEVSDMKRVIPEVKQMVFCMKQVVSFKRKDNFNVKKECFLTEEYYFGNRNFQNKFNNK